MRKGKSKLFARAAVAVAVVLATVFTVPSPAQAVKVRPGAQAFQIDVMLDGYETEQARRSYWAATVTCWNTGLMGQVTIFTQVCQGDGDGVRRSGVLREPAQACGHHLLAGWLMVLEVLSNA